MLGAIIGEQRQHLLHQLGPHQPTQRGQLIARLARLREEVGAEGLGRAARS